MMLHVWMLLVRLRADGDGTTKLRQELYDLFQEDVEVRVRQETPLRVNRWLVELEKDFYGSALALDKVRARLLVTEDFPRFKHRLTLSLARFCPCSGTRQPLLQWGARHTL